MKFSMIFEAQIVDTSRKGEYQIMQESVEQAVLGEKMGFDRIWAVEHHCLKWYAHMSAPPRPSSPTSRARPTASASATASCVCPSA